MEWFLFWKLLTSNNMGKWSNSPKSSRNSESSFDLLTTYHIRQGLKIQAVTLNIEPVFSSRRATFPNAVAYRMTRSVSDILVKWIFENRFITYLREIDDNPRGRFCVTHGPWELSFTNDRDSYFEKNMPVHVFHHHLWESPPFLGSF